MVCKLCGSNPAIKNSHIIPEFLYQDVYDEKHRFFRASTDPLRIESIHQKGLKEELLCLDCENKLSKWETYGKGVLHGGIGSVAATSAGLHFKDIDYTKFRLFLHSLLWRMSVSTQSWFVDVQLESNETIYRNFILSEDPGPEDKHWTSFERVLIDGKPTGLFSQPEQVRMSGKFYYRVVISGTIFLFSTSKTGRWSPTRCISKEGKLYLPFTEARSIPYLRKILFQMVKAFEERPEKLRRIPR